MDTQCGGFKRDGSRCTLSAKGPNGLCWAHDPKNAEKRQRMASRAGKSKPSREIRDLKKQLEDLAADVLEGRVERGDAVVVNQILNTRAMLIEIERKVREQDEVVGRIEALEQNQQQKEGRAWRQA